MFVKGCHHHMTDDLVVGEEIFDVIYAISCTIMWIAVYEFGNKHV